MRCILVAGGQSVGYPTIKNAYSQLLKKKQGNPYVVIRLPSFTVSSFHRCGVVEEIERNPRVMTKPHAPGKDNHYAYCYVLQRLC
jgi:hypothetical protein